jgi:putative copper resistance protein D
MAVLFVRSWEELFTGYGAMIVGKTLAFGLLMALASLNRWRLVPALAAVAARAGQAVGPLAAESRDLRRTIAAEWIVIALVLVATALMTSLFAPENLHATFGEGH